MPKPLPSKLAKEPLVEAVCEIRGTCLLALHTVLPGYLLAKFPGEISSTETLPAASIPEAARVREPMLEHAALVKVRWGNYVVCIGQRMVNISVNPPYPGWDAFREAALRLFRAVFAGKLFTGIQRYSVKYVNLFPFEEKPSGLMALDWDVRIGEFKLKNENTQLRIEMERPPFITLFTVSTPATIQLERQAPKVGLMLDVDSVCNHATNGVDAFSNELDGRLQEIRRVNKQAFFDSLTDETIQQLGPTYADALKH